MSDNFKCGEYAWVASTDAERAERRQMIVRLSYVNQFMRSTHYDDIKNADKEHLKNYIENYYEKHWKGKCNENDLKLVEELRQEFIKQRKKTND